MISSSVTTLPKGFVPCTGDSSHGLLAWLENTRVRLPLKGVECRFDVTAGLASVEMDQIFYQSAPQALDCTYVFPLPGNAAVYRCEMIVNDRLVKAVVREESVAREMYQQAKASGKRAALVETERPNLFTLSLGNLQPGDLVIIRFAWFSKLDRTGNSLSLHIPLCPGERYIPGNPLLRAQRGHGTQADTDLVPDASRITPPRIDALHPDAAYFSMSGSIGLAELCADTLKSPSHRFSQVAAGSRLLISLAGQESVPDCDMIFRWDEAAVESLAPQAWCLRGKEKAHVLVALQAPETQAGETAREAGHYHFLIDHSTSMTGRKWDQAVAAFEGFLKHLSEEDRITCTLFDSVPTPLWEGLCSPSQLRTKSKYTHLAELSPCGGTDLKPAVERLLQTVADLDAQGSVSVILITDGQVGNEQEIQRLLRLCPRAKVFTFGIDTAVNDAFLRDLAEQSGGQCWLQSPEDDIAGIVASLGAQLACPVLMELRTVGDEWLCSLQRPATLCVGGRVLLSFEGPATASELVLQGQRGKGVSWESRMTLVPSDNEALRLLWASERMRGLLRRNSSADALALASKHNLICKGASFVAVDEAERVLVATHELVQPALSPLMAMAPCMSPMPNRRISCDSSSSLHVKYFDSQTRPNLKRFSAAMNAGACCESSHYQDLDAYQLVAGFGLAGALKILKAWTPRVSALPATVPSTWTRIQNEEYSGILLDARQSLVDVSPQSPVELREAVVQWVRSYLEPVMVRHGRLQSLLLVLRAAAPERHRDLLAAWILESCDSQEEVVELMIALWKV